MLKHNHIDDTKCSPTFPFTNEAFDLLIKAATLKTPRFLNKLCDALLRDLDDDTTFDIKKEGEIRREVLEEKLPPLLGRLDEETV